jgi:hypothetical protein
MLSNLKSKNLYDGLEKIVGILDITIASKKSLEYLTNLTNLERGIRWNTLY